MNNIYILVAILILFYFLNNKENYQNTNVIDREYCNNMRNRYKMFLGNNQRINTTYTQINSQIDISSFTDIQKESLVSLNNILKTRATVINNISRFITITNSDINNFLSEQ